MNPNEYTNRRKEILKKMQKLVIDRININFEIKKLQKESAALDRVLMLE